MPKLPVLSGTQIVQALERLGFTAVRQRGSHVVIGKADTGTVVPQHREAKLGTLNAILRQAQVAPDDFLAALK